MHTPTRGEGEARLYARSSFHHGTRSLDVVVSAVPREGWLHPISAATVDLLRQLIRRDAHGVALATLSSTDIRALRLDVEGTLGIRLRRTNHVVRLAHPVAIVDQRTFIAEAA